MIHPSLFLQIINSIIVSCPELFRVRKHISIINYGDEYRALVKADTLCSYSPKFSDLNSVKLLEMMTYKVGLCTSKSISNQFLQHIHNVTTFYPELQIYSTFYKVTGHHLVLYFFYVFHKPGCSLNPELKSPSPQIYASFLGKNYSLFILLNFLIFNNSMYGRSPHIIYNIFVTDLRDYKICIFISLKQFTGYFFMKTYRLNNDTEQIILKLIMEKDIFQENSFLR